MTYSVATASVLSLINCEHFVVVASDIPEHIDVGGKQRPTKNSAGRLIYHTLSGIENFWRWFGDSKVVDASGRPLVCYHGTSGSFDKFEHSFSDGTTGTGHYFTTSPGVAETYAEPLKIKQLSRALGDAADKLEELVNKTNKEFDIYIPNPMQPQNLTGFFGTMNRHLEDGTLARDLYNSIIEAYDDYYDTDEALTKAEWTTDPTPSLMPVYLKVLNPYDRDVSLLPDWSISMMGIMDEVHGGGHDGAIVVGARDTGDGSNQKSTVVVVLDPNQIKSATGNKGDFSQHKHEITAHVAIATNEDTALYYKLRIVAEAVVATLRAWTLKSLAPAPKDFLEEYPWAGSGSVTTLRKLVGNKCDRLGPDIQKLLESTVLLQYGRNKPGAEFILRRGAIAAVVENRILMLPFYGGRPTDFGPRMQSVLLHELKHLYDSLVGGVEMDSTSGLDADEYYATKEEQSAFTEQLKLAAEHWIEAKLREIRTLRPGAGEVSKYTGEYEINPSRIDTVKALRSTLSEVFATPASFLKWFSANRKQLLEPYATALREFLEHQTSETDRREAVKSVLLNVYRDLKARYQNVIPGMATAMAAPTEHHKSLTLYHGTDEEHAQKILQAGYLQGRIKQGRAQLAPVAGYVYTSKDVMYAAGYAGAYTQFGLGCNRSRKEGTEKFTAYVFVVDTAKVTDILVDEDILGEIGTSRSNRYNLPSDWYAYLQRRAAECATPTQLQKARDGEYSPQAAIGKKMQRVGCIPEEAMAQLIVHCPHLALKHPEQRLPILGYYTIHKSVSTPEEFFANAEYHEFHQSATASEDYQDDTEYNEDHQFITKLGLIFGQPSAFNGGVKVKYKGRELEIKEAPFEVKTSEGRPASRGRKAIKPTYDYVPGVLISNQRAGVSHSERKEDAEAWLRGLKAHWDSKE